MGFVMNALLIIFQGKISTHKIRFHCVKKHLSVKYLPISNKVLTLENTVMNIDVDKQYSMLPCPVHCF